MTDWQKKYLKIEPTHPLIQDAADQAQSLAKWFAGREEHWRKTMLVLCGDTGTGKTHLARNLYKWARTFSGRTGAVSTWFSWPEACNAILGGFSGVVSDMIEADFLALDDIGAETDPFKGGVPTDRLCQILSRREKKFTVVTSNVGQAEWNQKFDVRVADRLLRNSTICDLSGVPSYAVAKILEGAK